MSKCRQNRTKAEEATLIMLQANAVTSYENARSKEWMKSTEIRLLTWRVNLDEWYADLKGNNQFPNSQRWNRSSSVMESLEDGAEIQTV